MHTLIIDPPVHIVAFSFYVHTAPTSEVPTTSQAPTSQACGGGTQEVVGSQNTSSATIAVSAILAVLFLLSLVVIIVLVFCVLRLNKQIGGMKGMR